MGGRDARFPSARERRGGVNPGPIWPCLALFTPSGKAEMRPPWPWLALRLLVRAGPGWPYFRLRWPRQEWAGVAKLLKQSHFLSFPLISLSPEPSSPPSPRGDFCITAPGGRSSSHPPARYACGGHPHAPGSGASPPLHSPIRGVTRAAPMRYAKVSSREKGFELRGNGGALAIL